MDWTTKTFPFAYLQTQALSSPTEGLILFWLKRIGVVPTYVEVTKGNRVAVTSLDPDAIPAGYIAGFAWEWDRDGGSTPREFIEALSFEVRGQSTKVATAEVLDGLAGTTSKKAGPAS